MKALIGVTGGWEPGEIVKGWPSVYVNKDLCDRIIKAGGLPVMIPVTGNRQVLEDVLARIDGLVMSGETLSIKRNVMTENETNLLRKSNPDRYDYEACIMKAALETTLPILGICRGFQVWNVECGGSVSDYDINLQSEIMHQQGGSLSPNETAHKLRVKPKSRLFGTVGAEEISVNSFHRQGTLTLAAGYISCAEAEDGVIEAMEDPAHIFRVGVQYHPEMLEGREHDNIFSSLVAAAIKNKD